MLLPFMRIRNSCTFSVTCSYVTGFRIAPIMLLAKGVLRSTKHSMVWSFSFVVDMKFSFVLSSMVSVYRADGFRLCDSKSMNLTVLHMER